MSGFLRFGSLPSPEAAEGQQLVNIFTFWWSEGRLPQIGLAEVAVIGAFVGFAGGGGLGNSMYSNYVRDKGWGMGLEVGAIPSAIGGKNITLSHLGKVFDMTQENMQRWRGWWKVIVIDQVLIWAPGCIVGMALPALLSLQFAPYSSLFEPLRQSAPASVQVASEPTPRSAPSAATPALTADEASEPEANADRFGWANAVITADGMRHAPQLSPALARLLWIAMLLMGLLVLLPSQISVVDDVSRRWTDVIWSASSRVRDKMGQHQVKSIYYTLCGLYFLWCMLSLYLFGVYGTPRLMTLVIANLGNLALGLTSLHVLHVNCRLLPPPMRPRWYQRIGLVGCACFYLGLAGLVFVQKQLPMIRDMLGE